MSQRVLISLGENSKEFRARVTTAHRIREKFTLSDDTVIVDVLNNGYLAVPRVNDAFDLSVAFGPYTLITR